MVVIPLHKPAHELCFGTIEQAAEFINTRLGMMIKKDNCEFDGERAVMFSVGSRKKKELHVNERATYFALLPSAEDDIYGTAIVAAASRLGGLYGFTLSAAKKIAEEINEL